jgi:LacI family transcriptional regulator
MTLDKTEHRRVTVVDVAKAAGVSIASVSRVLNGKSARPATVATVQQAIDALGYVPDGAGRALKLGRTLQVALAVDDVANPVYVEVMGGVEEVIAERDGRLLVSSTGHDPADLVAVVSGLAAGYADGLIISPLVRTPELMGALAASSVPVVLVGRDDGSRLFDTVTVDSEKGVRLALDHLVAAGHRSIGHIGGPTHTAPGGRRLAAYREFCAQHGLEPIEVLCPGFTVEDGAHAWRRLTRRRGTLPTAVLAANDTLALGVARVALSMGLEIPRQLAICGIDDIEFSEVFSPSLTTVSLRSRERGRLAAQLLLDRMDNPRRPARTLSVEPRLVVRESTSARRRR